MKMPESHFWVFNHLTSATIQGKGDLLSSG